jgi:hypothetical protein
MARIRYIGAEAKCTAFGFEFTQGVWVCEHGLDDEGVRILSTNPQFEAVTPRPILSLPSRPRSSWPVQE